MADINQFCGNCKECSLEINRHCRNRVTLGIKNKDGCHSDYFTAKVSTLYIVDDSISSEDAVFAEPLAAALSVQRDVHICPESNVLLIGAGRLGQLIALSLNNANGCNLCVLVKYKNQQKLLNELKINSILLEDINTSFELKENSFDVCVECSGTSDSFDMAMKYIKPRGTILLKSTYQGNSIVNMSAIVVKEVKIVGSRCGSISSALRFLKMNSVKPSKLIEKIYSINDALMAFEHASRPASLKILLSKSS